MATVVNYKDTFPFYRCGGHKSPGCNRLLTVFDEMRALRPNTPSVACGCGATQWRAANPVFWDWFTSLSPWIMTAAFLLGKVKNVTPGTASSDR